MKEEEVKRVLREGAEELGVVLGEEALGRFTVYLRELKLWSGKISLTSITSDEEIISRHFLDSLTPYGLIKELGCKRLLDIGSGAGFPSIPLKIVEPSLSVVLVDSVGKKVSFMRHIIRTLGLNEMPGEIRAVSARAEGPGLIEEIGGRFDCVISRAFSSLREFLEIGLPYCRKGGHMVAMKGPAVLEELAGLKEEGVMPGIVWAGVPEVTEVGVPGTDRVTTLVTFKKIGAL
jgi:16S rRNA (guanine527-N7)-methyltransferase